MISKQKALREKKDYTVEIGMNDIEWTDDSKRYIALIERAKQTECLIKLDLCGILSLINEIGNECERVEKKAKIEVLKEVLKELEISIKAWKQIERKKPLYETAKHMILLLGNWQHSYEQRIKGLRKDAKL
jgi:hypothetical protein